MHNKMTVRFIFPKPARCVHGRISPTVVDATHSANRAQIGQPKGGPRSSNDVFMAWCAHDPMLPQRCRPDVRRSICSWLTCTEIAGVVAPGTKIVCLEWRDNTVRNIDVILNGETTQSEYRSYRDVDISDSGHSRSCNLNETQVHSKRLVAAMVSNKILTTIANA